MIIRIEGSPKEVAALVMELQGRQEASSSDIIEDLTQRLQDLQDQAPQEFSL